MTEILLKLLNFLHIAIIVISLFPFFINDINLLQYVFYIYLLIFLGWVLFKDKCWLTLIENKLMTKKNKNYENSIIMYYLKKYFNITIDKKKIAKIYWFIMYSSTILLFFKLNKIHVGIIWVLLYEFYRSSVFIK